MNLNLLKLLSKNARYKTEELAAMTGRTEQDVTKEIAQMEKDGLIRGYKERDVELGETNGDDRGSFSL